MADVRKGLVNSAQLRSWHVQRHGIGEAESQKDGVELAPQFAQLHVLSEGDAHAKTDAAPFQRFQAAFDQFLVHAESGQSIHHPAAGFQAGIEDGDRIAAPGKGVGRHQTADAGANHGHALARGVFHRGFGQAVFPAVVQQEPREGADRHRVGFSRQDAGLLAHAPAHADVGRQFRECCG